MYKKEDLRQESIIMDTICIIDSILKKNNLNLFIRNYEIISINNGEGFIEIVNNSITLNKLKYENFSIQNYIIENATSTLTVNNFREKFVHSVAGFCLINFILGLGDRHLDNIMLTKHIELFHIDFGYVLGYEPKNLSIPEIRLTVQMLDALGGTSSKYYKKFQNICTKGFNILRRYIDIIYIQLTLLYKLNINYTLFNEEYIKNQIMKRFMPNTNYEEAKLKFIIKINNSRSSRSIYNYNLIDIVHNFVSRNDTKIILKNINDSEDDDDNDNDLTFFSNIYNKSTKILKNSIDFLID